MSALTVPHVLTGGYHSFRRFTVDEYHRMIATGILNELDQVELLEGYVVLKMPHNPPHDGTIQLVQEALMQATPAGWCIRIQSAVTLSESEPEPDLTVALGTKRTYLTRHPSPADIGLVVEVADSSLTRDRDDKGLIYARAGVPCYWIVNLQDRQVEVYTAPSGPTANPGYAQRQDHRVGDTIPLSLGGSVGHVAVRDLLP